MEFQYACFKEHIFSEYVGGYDTFGIKVFQKTEDGIKCINSISDVSIDSDLTKVLVKKCNEEQLDPIHLFDVVLDSIQNMCIDNRY